MSRPGVPAETTGIITIDVAAVCANWRSLRAHVAAAECAAVVKADCYGLGAARLVPALVAAGCRTFFVATPDEARAVRLLAPSAAIYVLDGLLPGTSEATAAIGARPVLTSLAEVREWAATAARLGRKLPFALHVDTGLHRLGMAREHIAELAATPALLADLDLTLIMSHLACADEPDHPMNERQRTTFSELRQAFPGVRASLAASDGLMLGPDYHCDMVRPGYALYGGKALPQPPVAMRQVLTAEALVLQVADVPAGATIGYGAAWTAQRPSRIATIAAGYADGLPRSASGLTDHNGADVAIHGHLCPIVGRISMDLATVDVTDLPGLPCRRGDWAQYIGPALPIEALGTAAATIGYEVLTRLGRRYHRSYTDSAA